MALPEKEVSENFWYRLFSENSSSSEGVSLSKFRFKTKLCGGNGSFCSSVLVGNRNTASFSQSVRVKRISALPAHKNRSVDFYF